jgi:hypothetical protein
MKKKQKFKIENRRSVFSPLEDWCTFSIGKTHDFIEVTEWTNGEGYDVQICDSQRTVLSSFTWGQFQLIKKLIKHLDESTNNSSEGESRSATQINS